MVLRIVSQADISVGSIGTLLRIIGRILVIYRSSHIICRFLFNTIFPFLSFNRKISYNNIILILDSWLLGHLNSMISHPIRTFLRINSTVQATSTGCCFVLTLPFTDPAKTRAKYAAF